MLNLWSEVTEGTFGTEDVQISGNYEAELESTITDDPVSMVEYVGSCTEGMIAVEAALAMTEGRNAVKYLTATDESAKAEVQAAMEGVLGDVWDKLKEYAERAYEAIKKFLKKVWAKMKGYANVVKAMVTKYGKVIGSKDTSGLKVSWVNVTLSNSYGSKLREYAKLAMGSKGNDSVKETANTAYKDELKNILYKGGDTEAHTVAFSGEIKSQAIKVADEGFDWLYKDLFNLTESSERDIIKMINEQKKTINKGIDKDDSVEDKSYAKGKVNRRCRDAIAIVRMGSVMGHAAATKLYQQSVTACRKAIRYNAGDKGASVESTDFSALMGEIL